ncbi:ATP-binding protein [Streptomyces sp. GQFP]|uniref:ATP-binding protein n=1 Tax=Streptomyces sp. GQFP TaxID=2907545 RepID=UPI001F2F7CE2|nr:ATP-binding protein [Streptomyces sp. GQFP]UIX30764.1 ATP-binding protein [Streptomyces sp. GQFP]
MTVESQQPDEPTVKSVEAEHLVPVSALISGGSLVDRVPLELSFGIIERFSEGLYSSPNKAFEELITNSYDAGAKRVWVALPNDLAAPGAVVVVGDDGESMGQSDLHDLWKIGESKKRTQTPPAGRKNPVGKFGIGKLATYVLARSLTYLVYQGGVYRAITMDFSILENAPAGLLNTIDLQLDMVELNRKDAILALGNAFNSLGENNAFLEAIRDNEPDHWTAVILTDLKPAAAEIELGRLRWILRTALPLHPDFKLYYNAEDLESTKADKERLWDFVVGKDEGQLPGRGKGKKSEWAQLATSEIELPDGSTASALQLPHAGLIAGKAILFKDPINSGKSERIERSHGFFVRVRGRLINLGVEAADFDLDVELRHGTLSRFFMEVWADGLDDGVASARESIKESLALDEVKSYLKAVFNRARTIAQEKDRDDKLGRIGKDNRLAEPPLALSQGPLRRMLRRAAEGDSVVQDSLGIVPSQEEDMVNAVESKDDLVEKIVMEPQLSSARFVSYDPVRRTVVLNESHPFVANYKDAKKVDEPLRLLGLTELLTEAYMLDENVAPEVVERVMRRRDSFLRALVKRYPRSATVIAQHLNDARNRKDDLEDAVADAFSMLGFHVVKRGGATHGTDGIATARLGRRQENAQSSSYAFTYDAKSSGESVVIHLDDDGVEIPIENTSKVARIRADTARTSILRVHRESLAKDTSVEIKPSFTVVVAPDFQGAEDPEALLSKVCENDDIVPIRVADLAKLVEVFPLQGLSPASIRPLFDLRSPADTANWIRQQEASVSVPRPRIDRLVQVLEKFSDKPVATKIQHLHAWMIADNWTGAESELEGLVRGLHALAPVSFFYQDGYIALNASIEALYSEIRASLEVYEDGGMVAPYLASMPQASR